MGNTRSYSYNGYIMDEFDHVRNHVKIFEGVDQLLFLGGNILDGFLLALRVTSQVFAKFEGMNGWMDGWMDE